jgi:uncharacterized MAPEG superfamily protein
MPMNTLIICLIIAIILPYLIKGVIVSAIKKQGLYDNHHPRIQQAHLEGIGARALAAHKNGFESLIVFSTAAIAAIATNHVGSGVQSLAIVYIVSRIIYNVLYLKDLATARTLIWSVGFLCCLAILIACMM